MSRTKFWSHSRVGARRDVPDNLPFFREVDSIVEQLLWLLIIFKLLYYAQRSYREKQKRPNLGRRTPTSHQGLQPSSTNSLVKTRHGTFATVFSVSPCARSATKAITTCSSSTSEMITSGWKNCIGFLIWWSMGSR